MPQNLFNPARGQTYSNSQLVVIVCSLLATYNSFELIILILTTFRKYRSLYFWSMLIASVGILPYNAGFLMEYFALAPDWAGVVVDVPGWIAVVTGQSVVLYSRLHLVVQNQTILRAVLLMIIVDGVIFHTSTTIVRFAAYYGGEQTNFRAAWNIIEKFQMTGFMLQESIISGIYLYETTKLLKVMKKNNTQRTVLELFTINVFIIVLDISLLVVEYLDLLVYEQTFKTVIYSIKLKLEFAILGKLVKIVRNGRHVLANLSEDRPDFVDMTVARQHSSDTGTTHAELMSIEEGDFRRYSVKPPEGVNQRWPGKPLVLAEHLEEFNARFGGEEEYVVRAVRVESELSTEQRAKSMHDNTKSSKHFVLRMKPVSTGLSQSTRDILSAGRDSYTWSRSRELRHTKDPCPPDMKGDHSAELSL